MINKDTTTLKSFLPAAGNRLLDKILIKEMTFTKSSNCHQTKEKYFFCTNKQTWFYVVKSQNDSVVTKFTIKDGRIFKTCSGDKIVSVGRVEANSLLFAAKQYRQIVVNRIYRPILNNLSQDL